MVRRMEDAMARHAGRVRRGQGLRAAVALAALLISLVPLTLRVERAHASARVAADDPVGECRLEADTNCVGPGDVRALYEVDALARRGIDGHGRTIAVVVSYGSPTLRDDLRAFDRQFGLPDPPLDILTPLGPPTTTNDSWAQETTLDVEWAHALAPGARIVVLESPVDETEGVQGLPEFLRLERYAADHHLADVISQSWAATEDTLLTPAGRRLIDQFHHFYEDATRQGITVVGASGDTGAAGYDLSLKTVFPAPAVGYPCSDPLVLCVGGTEINIDSLDSERFVDETAWDKSGGGVSKLFAEPDDQRGLPASAQRALRGRRGVPDVAAVAAEGSPPVIYVAGAWTPIAGTSAAAPQWAALIALADQAAGRDLGPVNGALYRLAGSPRSRADIYDVTHGATVGPADNGASLDGAGFAAAPGWDAATGLGSPRASGLIPDLVHALSRRWYVPGSTPLPLPCTNIATPA